MKTRGTLVGVVALLLAGTALPASAATDTLKDPTGDSVSARADWRLLTVTNTANRITARMDFVDLPRLGVKSKKGWRTFAATVEISSPDVPGSPTYRVGGARGLTTNQGYLLQATDASGTTDILTCTGFRIRWVPGAGGHVRLSVPRSCVDLASTIEVTAASTTNLGHSTSDRSVRSLVVPMD